MSEAIQAAAPEVAAQPSLPESQALPESQEATQAASLEEKQASGEKLTKKEERQLKEYRLKVNGRDKVVRFDPSNDDEVIKYLQKAEASDAKFAESAEIRKAAMAFIDELKKNPKRVLSDPNIGLDYKQLARQWMDEEIQEMEKSPEQKEREKLQRELEEIKAQREKERQEFETREFERMKQEHSRTLETEITAALDVGGLPKTPRTVKSMAEMMMIALEAGIDLSVKDIVPIVKKNNLGEFKEIVNALSDDQLEDFLGKEIIGRLRKRNVAKAKSAPSTASAVKPTGLSSAVAEATAARDAAKKIKIKDFLKL